MKTRFGALILLAAFSLAPASVRAAADAPSLTRITDAAQHFLASLDDAQRAEVMHPFDGEERFKFRYIPSRPPGLMFSDLSREQSLLLHALLNTCLSTDGYVKAATIMSLEPVVERLEAAEAAARGRKRIPGFRNSQVYTTTFFGSPAPDPSSPSDWGWRLQGHHVSQNFAIIGGEFFASSPSFFGAEPHRIESGPRAGLRALAAEEDLARALLASLSDSQRAEAIIDATAPNDIFSRMYRKIEFEDPPKGVASTNFSKESTSRLRDLVEEYVGNLPRELQSVRRTKVERGGWQNLHFVWMGSTTQGGPLYYRVQGPEFLIEFDNVQREANHSHSVWREYDGDFGEDLLAEHHAAGPHD